MLYSCTSFITPSPNKPVLVFLHGLLGSGEDWQTTLTELPDCAWMIIDLPGHGQSYQQPCVDFADCCKQISQTIHSQLNPETPVVLIGYSLGARIAMLGTAQDLFADINLQGLVIEGGNFGLQSDEEKQIRWRNDQAWAARFHSELIEQVLSDWYQQDVFSSLNDEQRQALVTKRSANLGQAIAGMLLATSLATQPYLLDALQAQSLPMHYICGAKDNKFFQLAQQSGLIYSQIERAGHNVHQEQPSAFAQTIRIFIDSLQ